MYNVIRLYQDETHPDHRSIVLSDVTLEEARAHCQDPSTRGDDWFDGFEEQ